MKVKDVKPLLKGMYLLGPYIHDLEDFKISFTVPSDHWTVQYLADKDKKIWSLTNLYGLRKTRYFESIPEIMKFLEQEEVNAAQR